ncbi:BQ5605_C005g03259 [Microbotryum silenes-dioicae]|uniref:BQ5605_C005g03259 protein n=1 Tax=Microbotryum silenes-dioicae TaxID=796604 RepID=A0A2X0MEB2_9BASI|nr:BQ5605_C005g03259 [Microbotryum silenes-dioicae]
MGAQRSRPQKLRPPHWTPSAGSQTSFRPISDLRSEIVTQRHVSSLNRLPRSCKTTAPSAFIITMVLGTRPSSASLRDLSATRVTSLEIVVRMLSEPETVAVSPSSSSSSPFLSLTATPFPLPLLLPRAPDNESSRLSCLPNASIASSVSSPGSPPRSSTGSPTYDSRHRPVSNPSIGLIHQISVVASSVVIKRPFKRVKACGLGNSKPVHGWIWKHRCARSSLAR